MIKMFLWQACSNILPTKENLFRKHIISDPMCPVCGQETETVGHALWGCTSARDVWLECTPRIQKCISYEEEFSLIFERLLERLDANDIQLVGSVAIQIWLHRNSLIFNGEFLVPYLLVQRDKDQVEACTIADKERGIRQKAAVEENILGWQKPSEGRLKFNWDAAIDGLNNRMGIGVIVRDHEGKVPAMLCASKEHISDPNTAEVVAAWKAVDLARRLDCHSFVLEGDTLAIVQALRKDGSCWSVYGQIVNDVKRLLDLNWNWEVLHVRLTGNKAAHRLAKLALEQGEDRLWRRVSFVHAGDCNG